VIGGIKRTKEDIKFSLLVRLRAKGRCEYCLKIKDIRDLQCSHFHGRRKASVRHDLDNASALCFACHLHLTENPLTHTEFFKKRLGDKFDLLTLRANTPGKPDMKLLNLFLEQEIKKYDKST
jgi:5-methylcytosine-specific restriction endonuclease McrA